MIKLNAAFTIGTACILGLAITPAAANNTVHACKSKSGGDVRIVNAGKKCKTNETKLTWNKTGPKGAKGARGKVGPQGPPGEDGSSEPAFFLEPQGPSDGKKIYFYLDDSDFQAMAPLDTGASEVAAFSHGFASEFSRSDTGIRVDLSNAQLTPFVVDLVPDSTVAPLLEWWQSGRSLQAGLEICDAGDSSGETCAGYSIEGATLRSISIGGGVNRLAIAYDNYEFYRPYTDKNSEVEEDAIVQNEIAPTPRINLEPVPIPTAPAAQNATIFAQVEGVAGSSEVKTHKQWNQPNHVSGLFFSRTDNGKGRIIRDHPDSITIIKPIERDTFIHAHANTPIRKGGSDLKIDFCRTAAESSLFCHTKYEMPGALLQKHSIRGSSEHLTVIPTKSLKVTSVRHNPRGKDLERTVTINLTK